MQAVIRTYAASPDVIDEARPQLADLEQTMRKLPGFVAYYFIETADGLATVTVTEDEAGAQASMQQAAAWVKQHLKSAASMGAPQVAMGPVLIAAK
jgi:quinol monooxygenase YgiN